MTYGPPPPPPNYGPPPTPPTGRRPWLIALAVAVVVIVVAGIAIGVAVGTQGSGSSSASNSATPAPTSTTPETTSINVELTDSLPLSVFYNGGHGRCTTRLLGLGSPMQIVVKDASGTTVDAATLPTVGGTFYAGTCAWPYSATVPVSKFYTVTATAGQFSESATVPSDTIAKLSFD